MTEQEKTAVRLKPQKFSGQVLNWDLVDKKNRQYILGAMRYGQLRNYIKADVYSSATGLGEQREPVERHIKVLKNAMSEGKFVPTPFSIGTRKIHRDSLVVSEQGKKVELFVNEENKLPLVDANHRFEALERIRSDGNPLTRRAVDNLRIPYILYLDGDPRDDFVVLQAGMPANKAHMLSVRIETGMADDKDGPFFKMAKEAAQLLHETDGSFCKNLIKMDSRVSKLPISLSSLCAKGASELAFSLFGFAKLATKHKQDAGWIAQCIDLAYNAIKDDAEASKLLEDDKVLCPNGGVKVGTTFIIALGLAIGARAWLNKREDPSEEDIDLMVSASLSNLNVIRKGNSSSERKRILYHEFLVDFFSDMEDDGESDIGFHDGVPVYLINLLQPSTFGVSKLPKAPKKKGRKPKATSGIVVEVTDAELEEEEGIEAELACDDPDFAEEDEAIAELAKEAPWEEE
jgi:hypothetical protein